MSGVSTPSSLDHSRANMASQLGTLLFPLIIIVTTGWFISMSLDYSSLGSLYEGQDVFQSPSITQDWLVRREGDNSFINPLNGNTLQNFNWFLFGDDVSSFLSLSKITYHSVSQSRRGVGHILALCFVLNIFIALADIDILLNISKSVLTEWGSVLFVGSKSKWVAVVPLLSVFFDLLEINTDHQHFGYMINTRDNQLNFFGYTYLGWRGMVSLFSCSVFVASQYNGSALSQIVGLTSFTITCYPFWTKVRNFPNAPSELGRHIQLQARSIISMCLWCFTTLYVCRMSARVSILHLHPYIETIVFSSIEHGFIRCIMNKLIDCTGFLDHVGFMEFEGVHTRALCNSNVTHLRYGTGQILEQWKHDLSRTNTFLRYITHEMGSPISSLALAIETFNQTLARLEAAGGVGDINGGGDATKVISNAIPHTKTEVNFADSVNDCSGSARNMHSHTVDYPPRSSPPQFETSQSQSRNRTRPRSQFFHHEQDQVGSDDLTDLMEAVNTGRTSLTSISKIIGDMRSFQESLAKPRSHDTKNRLARERGKAKSPESTLTMSSRSRSQSDVLDLPCIFDVDGVIFDILNSPHVLEIVRAHNIPKVTVNHHGTGAIKTSLGAFRLALESLIVASLEVSVVHLPVNINVNIRRRHSEMLDSHFGMTKTGGGSNNDNTMGERDSGYSRAGNNDITGHGGGKENEDSVTEAELTITVVFHGDLYPQVRIDEIMGRLPWYATCVPGGAAGSGELDQISVHELSGYFGRMKTWIQPMKGRVAIVSEEKLREPSKWATLLDKHRKVPNNTNTNNTYTESTRKGANENESRQRSSFGKKTIVQCPRRTSSYETLPSLINVTSHAESSSSAEDIQNDSELPNNIAASASSSNPQVQSSSSSKSHFALLLERKVADELSDAINKFTMKVNVLHIATNTTTSTASNAGNAAISTSASASVGTSTSISASTSTSASTECLNFSSTGGGFGIGGTYTKNYSHKIRFIDPDVVASYSPYDDRDDEEEIFDFSAQHKEQSRLGRKSFGDVDTYSSCLSDDTSVDDASVSE